jgi:hypothetical protein
MPITTLDAVLDIECAKFCGNCAEPLDPPGSACPQCGVLPTETREEARDRLAAEPDAIARAEAARLRTEARQLLLSAEHVFRMADEVGHRSELRRRRDEAQDRLKEAADVREGAVSALAEAVKAEGVTARPLADASAARAQAEKAEEKARRLRKGAEAEIEASVRLSAAGQVLARYQAEAATAARMREGAELAVLHAEQAVRDREEARDQAQVLLDRHATVPLSGETAAYLATPLLRMACGWDIDGRPLDQVERGMIGVWGRGVHAAAFADFADALDQADEDRIRRQIEEEARQQPFLRPVGDGFLEARLAAPKADARPPAGAVVTPAPGLSPASPFSGAAPGLPVRPIA